MPKDMESQGEIKQVSIKCMIPHCKENVLVNAPPAGVVTGSLNHLKSLSGTPMCENHSDMLSFYIWAQINLKVQPQQTKAGIILPGHTAYKSTISEGQL